MNDKQLKKLETIRVNINKLIKLNTELTNSINHFGQASRCSRVSDSLENALDHIEILKEWDISTKDEEANNKKFDILK